MTSVCNLTTKMEINTCKHKQFCFSQFSEITGDFIMVVFVRSIYKVKKNLTFFSIFLEIQLKIGIKNCMIWMKLYMVMSYLLYWPNLENKCQYVFSFCKVSPFWILISVKFLIFSNIHNLFATSEPPKYSKSNSPNLCFDSF